MSQHCLINCSDDYFRELKFSTWYQRFSESTLTTVDKTIITQQFKKLLSCICIIKYNGKESLRVLSNIFIIFDLAYKLRTKELHIDHKLSIDYELKNVSNNNAMQAQLIK